MKRFLSQHISDSTQSLGVRFYSKKAIRFGIGNLSQDIKDSKFPELVPPSYNDPFLQSLEFRDHLRWIMQKDILGQDMLLMGENTGEIRRCVYEWLRLGNREVEYVSLSQDSGHEDLRQRRELNNNSSILIDQAAVRAAIHGRVLLLEGIDRVERNILPLLNNLLENREITLDDGRLLLPNNRVNKLNDQKGEGGIALESVHDQFRVIGIMRVNAKDSDNSIQAKLDPPLRSRFQARYISSLSATSLLAILQSLAPTVHSNSPAILTNYIKLYNSVLSFKSDQFKDLVTPPRLIPLCRVFSFVKGLEQLSEFIGGERSESENEEIEFMQQFLIHKLLRRSYPFHIMYSDIQHQSFAHLLNQFRFAAPPADYSLAISSVQPHSEAFAKVVGSVSDKSKQLTRSIEFLVRIGSDAAPEPTVATPGEETEGKYISTPSTDNILFEMVQDHSLQQDICLIGEKGSGETTIIKEFARILGYSIEGMLLYKDMTSRDLTLRRVTVSSANKSENAKVVENTSWEYSPLIKAAILGRIAVLDNIDRLSPTALSTLSSFIQDREITLFDGTRLVSQEKYSQLLNTSSEKELSERKVIPIHPAFRIIATSNSNQISSDVFEMFHFHYLPFPSLSEAKILFSQLVPGSSMGMIDKLVELSNSLKQDQHLNMSFGVRQVKKTLEKIQYLEETGENEKKKEKLIRKILANSCLTYFTPTTTQVDFNDLLNNFQFQEFLNKKSLQNEHKLNGKYLLKNQHNNQINKETAHLIPEIVFFENKSQQKILDEISIELALGHHVLLIGNQGVGKNKLTDRLLELLKLPREYIQLHRDVTVQSLTGQNVLKDGGLFVEDSRLIHAVKKGHVLVIDEADKAPREVICILKGLIDGEMFLPDGRKIVSRNSTTWLNYHKNAEKIHYTENNDAIMEENKATTLNAPIDGHSELLIESLIPIHPDFRMIVLANRPNWPFQGNDFYAECGDLFSCHAILNPDRESQIEIVRNYAPSVNIDLIKNIVAAFDELREHAENGILEYPYSTRECVSVIKHLQKFPNDTIAEALNNVLAFDTFDEQAKRYLLKIFSKYKIEIGDLFPKRSVLGNLEELKFEYLEKNSKNLTMWVEYENDRKATSPKYGREDPKNEPHVGGNTWAGGTGGADTAGLGGKGGPFRLDKGHPVHQISDEQKRNISKESLDAARKMGEELLQKRLKEIEMSAYQATLYENYLNNVSNEVAQLRAIIRNLQNKGKERIWVKNKTSGDLDDTKLVDAIAGDRNVYKVRTESESMHWSSDKKNKKIIQFVMDVSGSMYRFNGTDNRLERMLEIAVIIMESFHGFEDKIDYCITGHSGDSPAHKLVPFSTPPTNRLERYKVLSKMIAYSQYCMSGDNTVEAAKKTIHDLSAMPTDNEKILFLFSDANFERYGINPVYFGNVLRHPKVSAHAFFIASFWNEAERIIAALPPGKGHASLQTSQLPGLFKTIFRNEVLNG